MSVNRTKYSSFSLLMCEVHRDGIGYSQKFCFWVSVPKRLDLNTEYTLSVVFLQHIYNFKTYKPGKHSTINNRAAER